MFPCPYPVYQAVYSRDILTVAPTTLRWLSQAWLALVRFGGEDAPAAITPRLIQEWHCQIQREASPTTANNNLRAVSIIFRRLVSKGVVEDNPASGIPPAPQLPRRPEAVSAATYRALCAVAGVRDNAILCILWGTGCRVGEIATMTIDNIDRWTDGGAPRMAVAVIGKYHRRLAIDHATRYVYADGAEARAVNDWLAIRPPTTSTSLFTSRSGDAPMSEHTIRSVLRILGDRAGVVECHNPHAFRHAFAERKRSEGYPLEWISEWLGHSDPAFTAKMYGDKTEAAIRRRFFDLPPARHRG